MPGKEFTSGEDVACLELPTPFFLRDDPFEIHGFGLGSSYDWEAKKDLSLLVRKYYKIPYSKPMGGSTGEELNDVSLGGEPLECPFDPNENFDDALSISYVPDTIFPPLDFSLDLFEAMDLNSCRVLVRKIYEENEKKFQKIETCMTNAMFLTPNPVYLACDGGKPDSKDLFLIGFEQDKFLEVRVMGPYKRESLDMDLLLSFHQRLPTIVPSVIHKQVHAIYEKCHGDFPSQGKVYLEFVWPEPKDLFELPPPSARVKVAILPKPGDASPHLRELWLELTTLESIIHLLETGDNPEYNKAFYHQQHSVSVDEGGDTNNSPVVEGIKSLLKIPSTPCWGTKEEDISSSLTVVLERVLKGGRSDVDFTDKAWSILKGAKYIPEIWECFFHIFVNIEEKFWRPYLLPGNGTEFDKIIKQLHAEHLTNFRTILTPNKAVEMTVEIGLVKLYRDYSFVLRMCHLAEASDLVPYAPNPKSFRESLLNLKKLHCLCEVLCLAKERLSLPIQEQQPLAQVVLSYYEHKNSLEWHKPFHFDMHISMLLPLLVGLDPIYWNIRLESQTLLRNSRTNMILSRDSFLKHAVEVLPTQDPYQPRGFFLYIHRMAQRRQ